MSFTIDGCELSDYTYTVIRAEPESDQLGEVIGITLTDEGIRELAEYSARIKDSKMTEHKANAEEIVSYIESACRIYEKAPEYYDPGTRLRNLVYKIDPDLGSQMSEVYEAKERKQLEFEYLVNRVAEALKDISNDGA